MRIKLPGVYRFFNTTNGKSYVGSTTKCIRQRQREHLSSLHRGSHANRPFQTAWDRDGKQAWSFELLEPWHATTKDIVDRERYWIKKLNATDHKYGYNICPAANTRLGTKWSETSKKQRSKSMKGQPTHPNSIAALRKSAKARIGKKRHPSIGAKISATKKGVPFSPEHIENMRKPRSPEARASMRSAWIHRKERLGPTGGNTGKSSPFKGAKKSTEFGAKISAAKMGHVVSQETREKLSRALKGKPRGRRLAQT